MLLSKYFFTFHINTRNNKLQKLVSILILMNNPV